jgi:nitrogen regulatory protein P-II 2
MTVTEVKGFGRQKGHVDLYRGAQYEVNFLPKIKIGIAVADEKEEAAVNIIAKSARAGGVLCSCQWYCSILREKGRS